MPRIGLFGGSFDPVHLGHLLVAQAATEELGLERLYFIPAAQSPFKPENKPAPAAAGGSLPFLPAESLRCLRTFRARFGSQAWTRYGFADAFNPADGWVAPDVIGINAGITLLMAENARTAFVWKTFMKNPQVLSAMEKVGLRTVNAVTQATP